MEGGTKNLCAQIPIEGEYMTWLITTFYQFEEEQKMTNTETRTVAFQVPAELFEAFKDYLQRRGMKQKEFFLACIQNALADEAEEPVEETEQETEAEQKDLQEENE